MRRSDVVRFGIARDYSANPPTLPSVIEAMGCRVFVEHLYTMDELTAFFNAPAVDAQYTVLHTHGWGKTDDEAVINWPLFDPQTWTLTDFHLTPDNMGEMVTKGTGTLIVTACWSGKAAFARGFLQAGFDHYIAPICSSDCTSMLQFLTAFFGYLRYEERDYQPRIVPITEAVELSKRIDDYPDGASAWRYFDIATIDE